MTLGRVRCCAQARLVAPDGLESDLCLTALISDQLTYLVERGARSGGVELLRGRLGRATDGRVVGDAVPVSVGRDHTCGLAPGRGSSSIGERCSECLRPRGALGKCAIECGVGACLDQFLSLVESGSHLDVDDSVRLWDEAGDESCWLTGSA